MATSTACMNPQPGSALASACACQAAANALAASLTQYNAEIQKYGVNQAIYTSALKKYNTDHAQWRANRSGKRAELANELITMACGGCGTNPGCNNLGSGWVSVANPLACGRDALGTPWGCNNICQRTETQVNTDLGAWDRLNPEPQAPPRVPPVSMQVPNGNNITCCSQEFSGIRADSVSFNNILQNCNQQIQQKIAAEAVKPSTSPSTSTSPSPSTTTSSNTLKPVPTNQTATNNSERYVIALGIFCGLLILLAILIFIGWLAIQ